MNDPKRIIIVALIAIVLLPLGFTIKAAIDDGGEKNARMYNTAIQAKESDRFNYAVDSRQGLLLGEGEFKADAPVKFDDMSGSYAWVDKITEEYTRHEREVCETKYRTETHYETVTDADGNTSTEAVTEEVPYEECHTEEYYSWDYAGSEDKQTPTVTLFGRKYPFDLFGTDDYKRSEGSYVNIDHDTRYYYRVIDASFSGAFVADVREGGLKSVTGKYVHVKKTTIEQIVAEANDYHLAGNVFITLWFVFILAIMGGVAYAWAMNDGVFKTNE